MEIIYNEISRLFPDWVLNKYKYKKRSKTKNIVFSVLIEIYKELKRKKIISWVRFPYGSPNIKMIEYQGLKEKLDTLFLLFPTFSRLSFEKYINYSNK